MLFLQPGALGVQQLGLLGQVAAAVPDAWPLLKADLFLREADRLHKAGVSGVLPALCTCHPWKTC